MDISVSERHDASVFRAIYNLSKVSRETPKTSRLCHSAASLRIRACCKTSVADERQRLWSESVATSFKLRSYGARILFDKCPLSHLTPRAEAYRGADKSLARPGRKRARKHVRDARDFNNIETRVVIKLFFLARQGAEGNSCHSDRNISLFPSWSGYGLISTPV